MLGVAPGEEERPIGGNRARRAAQLEAPRWQPEVLQQQQVLGEAAEQAM